MHTLFINPVVLGLIAFATIYYLMRKKQRAAAPASPRPRLMFGSDANLAFYAARFVVGKEAIEPEHLLATALFDARVAGRLHQIAPETARADLLATARHLASPAAEPHDYNPGEHYSNARVSLRLMVSARRAHQLASQRHASAISLGDLLRALRERGGLLGQLIGDADLGPLDAERTVEVGGRTVAAADATGDVEVYAVNDDVTSMAMVLSLLAEVWELSPEHAAWVMQETNDKGHGRIGRFEAGLARQRVARATVAARAANMPLTFALYMP